MLPPTYREICRPALPKSPLFIGVRSQKGTLMSLYQTSRQSSQYLLRSFSPKQSDALNNRPERTWLILLRNLSSSPLWLSFRSVLNPCGSAVQSQLCFYFRFFFKTHLYVKPNPRTFRPMLGLQSSGLLGDGGQRSGGQWSEQESLLMQNNTS